MRALGLVLIAAACAACTGEVSEVLVRIDAQPASRARAERVRVHVITTEGAVVTHELEADGAFEYPLILPLVPNGDPSMRRWTVEAELLDASNTAFSWARLSGGYVRGEIREVLLCFTDLCSDVPCETCLPTGDAGPAGACTTCTGATRTCAPPIEAALMDRGSAALCPEVECVASATTETLCSESDPNDDDCDAAYNCQDSDCAGASCGANGRVCMGGACACPAGDGEDSVALCHDGVDNDCDGLVDCADEDPCRTFAEDCTSSEDEDCDGQTSCDSECVQLETTSDKCHDGIDNDCDGFADCDDEACCADGNCNGNIVGERGSYPRFRCCAQNVVDVFDNANNCGACGVACDAGFMCVMVQGAGAACRCMNGNDASCPPGFVCRDLEGQITCDCDDNGDCGHYMDCQTRGGAMFHNLCGPLL